MVPSALRCVHIQVAICVVIGKCDAVSFAQVSHSRVFGQVGKGPVSIIAIKPVWFQASQVRIARPEVHVQVPVVIYISHIAAHHAVGIDESRFVGYICEAPAFDRSLVAV